MLFAHYVVSIIAFHINRQRGYHEDELDILFLIEKISWLKFYQLE